MVSRAGCAPQIVHGDTVFTPHAVMHTAFVALQVRVRVRVTSRRHAHGLRRATGAHVKGLKRTHSLTRDLPIHLATHLLTYYVHLLTYPRLLTYHVHLRTYPRLLTKPLTHELSYRAAADRKAPAGPTYYLLLTTYYLLLTTYYLQPIGRRQRGLLTTYYLLLTTYYLLLAADRKAPGADTLPAAHPQRRGRPATVCGGGCNCMCWRL